LKCAICGREIADGERTVVVDVGRHVEVAGGGFFEFKGRILGEVHLKCFEEADGEKVLQTLRNRLRSRIREIFRPQL